LDPVTPIIEGNVKSGLTFTRSYLRTTIRVIWLLAIVGMLLTLSLLLLPSLNLPPDWANRAQVSAAISSAFALILSIVAIVVSVRVSSSDYRAEQDVRAQTVQLLASLRSIDVKGAVLTQKRAGESSSIDFKKEREMINDFLSSTTAFAFWSWAGYKSEQAGDKPEGWRIFFLDLAYILDESDTEFRSMMHYSVEVENLLIQLSTSDIQKISQYVLDLSKAVGTFKDSREKNVLLKAISEVFETKGKDAKAS